GWAKCAGDEGQGEHQRRSGEPELQQSKRFMLAVRERFKGDVKQRRRKRNKCDEEDRNDKDAVVDRLIAEACAREDRPVRDHDRSVDELQQMTTAPEELIARPREAALVSKQNPSNCEARQRENIDEAGERHRNRERRRRDQPSRQINQEPDDRRENTERER